MTSGASNVWSTCAGGPCIYRLWRLRLECCVNTGKNPGDPLNLRVKTVLRLPTLQLPACLSLKIWKAIHFSVAILPFKESRNFYYYGWFSHSLDFISAKSSFIQQESMCTIRAMEDLYFIYYKEPILHMRRIRKLRRAPGTPGGPLALKYFSFVFEFGQRLWKREWSFSVCTLCKISQIM